MRSTKLARSWWVLVAVGLLLLDSVTSFSTQNARTSSHHHWTISNNVCRPSTVRTRSTLSRDHHDSIRTIDIHTSNNNGSVSKRRASDSKTDHTNLGNNGDSAEKLSKDITKVLKELRASDDDPEVLPIIKSIRLSMANVWTLDDWAQHTSRSRFIQYALSLPTSRLLRRIAPQFSVFVVWTALAVTISPRGLLTQAVVPLTPLSLVSTFVGALLTMRSNTGLSRLAEGRVAWGEVVLNTREVGQLIASKIYPRDPQVGFLLARHTSIFGWVLKAHLRGTQEDVSDVVRTMLPPIDAEYVLSQRKLPVAIMAKLRQGIQQLASQGQLTTAEEMALDRSIERLDHALMTADRICASPIPPLYTSHTSRLLMFYLFALPLALYKSSLNGFVTVLISYVVGYTMLGLDEISHLLEQPFRNMPLLKLSKLCMIDVGDSMICQPAPMEQSLSQLGGEPVLITKDDRQQEEPDYW